VVFITAILAVLEVSLSFDNAVVNAKVLQGMTPLWRRRFLTWGMVIAVFGMRLIFPLAIVGFVASLAPWDALRLAAFQPDEYARIMLSAHIPISGFGGAFLLMVALRYFFDINKDVHWIKWIERPLVRLGKMNSIEIGVSILAIYAISKFVQGDDNHTFMMSAMMGLVTFIAVDGVSAFLEGPEEHPGKISDVHKVSAAAFLYLEVLDASFSFDGVVGSFAVTNNLFIITIGLGIGAMFVRSLTIMLVDRGTLSEFRYLEHGAFYAIGALAALMFLNTVTHVPEVISGLIGAAFIAAALATSIIHNKKVAKRAESGHFSELS
jgi:hypothetical protein